MEGALSAIMNAAPPVRKVFGWARGVHQPSTPHDPAEYDIDFVYGDDQPSGEGWFAVYREPAPAVAVKPLEWARGWMNAEATSILGPYKITYRRDGSFEWSIGEHNVWASSWDAAKAAAQADYEQRIRSALVEPAPAVAVPEGWRLVPVEPTEDMRRAAFDVLEIAPSPQFKTGTAARNAIYAAMLAAAPQPPATRSYEEGKRGGRREGIEAAAKWHEEEARKANKVDWNGSAARSHARYASAIRSLARG